MVSMSPVWRSRQGLSNALLWKGAATKPSIQIKKVKCKSVSYILNILPRHQRALYDGKLKLVYRSKLSSKPPDVTDRKHPFTSPNTGVAADCCLDWTVCLCY